MRKITNKELSREGIDFLKEKAKIIFMDSYIFYAPSILDLDLSKVSRQLRVELETLAEDLILQEDSNILIKYNDKF